MSLSLDEMRGRIGLEVGLSRWFDVGQPMIDAFAELTDDRQYIHTDPERAAATPFNGTIAHGFLTLSLLSAMASDCVAQIEGVQTSINTGFDRIRFVAPVPAGSRIRGRFVLADLTEPEPGIITLAHDVSVEIEGLAKPALVARWLSRRILA